ncbi:MAG: lamin tail domain-containing protein [Chloroflexi bacterium]|nr:lamin tail domain-containing protein [Chloroflexota bacterium]
MSKGKSWAVQSGQLTGAKIEIETVQNDGLQESVTIINQGTVVQPMSGWVLASLRGLIFYPFPENFILHPDMGGVIHSGQAEIEKVTNLQAYREVDLWWTTDQVWNNHWDTAMLFDANGLEIDRRSYPHERVMGSSANRQKVLIRHNGAFEITDAPLVRAKKVTRKQNKMIAS